MKDKLTKIANHLFDNYASPLEIRDALQKAYEEGFNEGYSGTWWKAIDLDDQIKLPGTDNDDKEENN